MKKFKEFKAQHTPRLCNTSVQSLLAKLAFEKNDSIIWSETL